MTPTHLNQTQVAQVKMDMDIKMDGHLVACMKHMLTENKFEWQWHFLEDGPTRSCVRIGQGLVNKSNPKGALSTKNTEMSLSG